MSMYSSETKSNYAQNGKLILASTTLFFLLLLIFIFLHTFHHTCFCRCCNNHHHSHRNRRHPLTNSSSAVAFDQGLHPSILASLPTFTHSSSLAATASDNCAVCMSEFATGDDGRTLPSCRHVFHSHCFDAWFLSHSNCPLCRIAVPLSVRPNMVRPDNVELCLASWSSFPGPVWCPRMPLELEEEKLRKSYCINVTLTPRV